jgi:hypothetical protein
MEELGVARKTNFSLDSVKGTQLKKAMSSTPTNFH